MLAWTIYLSFAGALLQALLPKGNAALARWLALGIAVAGLLLVCWDSLRVWATAASSSPMLRGFRKWASATRWRRMASAWFSSC